MSGSRIRDVDSKGIHRRINAQLRDFTAQYGRGIQMRECRGRGRVGQVVGRHVHGLYRSNRAVLRGCDTFLHLSHFGSQCRLITHGRGHTSQQGGHFGTGLGETEDVVDEEQNVTRSVSLIVVTERLG